MEWHRPNFAGYAIRMSKPRWPGLVVRSAFSKRLESTESSWRAKLKRRSCFSRFGCYGCYPDWRTIHMWVCYARRDRKDDTLLSRSFANSNVTTFFSIPPRLLSELLVNHGFLTKRKPTESQWRDIHFGWDLAKEMGRLDVGQSVVVHDMAVIAVEAIEGQIERSVVQRNSVAGAVHCGESGQAATRYAVRRSDNWSSDLRTMHESGGRVLAIESGRRSFSTTRGDRTR